jgi:hypothetical protein
MGYDRTVVQAWSVRLAPLLSFSNGGGSVTHTLKYNLKLQYKRNNKFNDGLKD